MSFSYDERQTIARAIDIIANHYKTEPLQATSPDEVKRFCQLQLGHLEHEVFGVLFLNNRHQLIKFTELFRGTIDGASVHPREVAKEALFCNASAVIFTHNHPSSVTEPSQADERITARLVEALTLFDIRVLDHIVVGARGATSFAERGLL